MQANTHLLVKEHELIDAKKRLEAALPMNPVLKKQKKLNELSKELKSGDEVKVLSFGQKGTLLDKLAKSVWSVQIGMIKMKIDEADLEYVKPEKAKANCFCKCCSWKRYTCEIGIRLTRGTL